MSSHRRSIRSIDQIRIKYATQYPYKLRINFGLIAYPTIELVLACGVPCSANDYVIYSPVYDRSQCTKPSLNFEVGYPDQVPPCYADWLLTHHQPTYHPTTETYIKQC
eukprot:2486764-Pleurochrysis_carterae.AAC.1